MIFMYRLIQCNLRFRFYPGVLTGKGMNMSALWKT